VAASTDTLAVDAFGWDELLKRKGQDLPQYLALAAEKSLGNPDWRGQAVKEVQVG
jgi:hypothetical protein